MQIVNGQIAWSKKDSGRFPNQFDEKEIIDIVRKVVEEDQNKKKIKNQKENLN